MSDRPLFLQNRIGWEGLRIEVTLACRKISIKHITYYDAFVLKVP